jgi:ABC-type sugar transport system ATPase subunit
MTTSVLSVRGLDKRFGPVAALASVDFSLEAGEIHALLGVNGAGKSTFVKILSGVYLKDAGSIFIKGQLIELSGERDAIAAGVTSVQQHPELIDDLSGYENIFLGQEADRPGLFRRIDHQTMRRRAQTLLERFAVAIDLMAPLSSLQPVEKEIVAILHALYRSDMKVLILDEPTSTLTRIEKVKLFELMRSLKASGVAIIYITHRLEEVFEVADRFTVFRAGRNVATFTSEEASRRDISIPKLMLEGELGDLYPPKRATPPGEVLLEVQALTYAKAYHDVSFQIRRGEILGIFGLVGLGIDELAKTLFGVLKPDSGAILLKSKRVAADLVRRIDLNPPHLWQIAAKFSGGNQQKIVVAKGLFRQAETYIFVEPTTFKRDLEPLLYQSADMISAKDSDRLPHIFGLIQKLSPA